MSLNIHSLLFSRIFIRSMNARIESRENWTRACSLRSHTPAPPPPTSACFALASLAFSLKCVNYREAVNSLRCPRYVSRFLLFGQPLSQECEVELWLDSYISCYICLTKLNFSQIIKVDVLPCLNILF